MVNKNDELERLRRQLAAVTAERDKLLAENRRLRRDYSTGPQAAGEVSLPPATTKEDNLLKMLWPSAGREAILAAFPDRTYHAIKEKARKLGVRRKRDSCGGGASAHWTEEEKVKLAPLYEVGTPLAEIAAELGRSQGAIVVMASKLNLRRPKDVKWKRLEPIWSEAIESLEGSKAECSML